MTMVSGHRLVFACGMALAAGLAMSQVVWPSRLVLELDDTSGDGYQLFYDRGAGFVQHDSIRANAEPGTAGATVRFPLPADPVHRLRLDPPARQADLRLRTACVENRAWPHRKACWAGPDLIDRFVSTHEVAKAQDADGAMRIRATGLDPYLESGDLSGELRPVTAARRAEVAAAVVLGFLAGWALSAVRLATWRRLAPNAVLAIISLLMGACLIEAILIVEPSWLKRGALEYDPDIGFRMRAHHLGTNRFGFNDRDYPLARALGSYRVLVVGDSFNWAGGPDGNYTALMERSLAERFPGRTVEVITAGYPGLDPRQELAVTAKYGMQYQPDLVLLSIYAGNDLFECFPDSRQIVVGDAYVQVDARRPLPTLFGRPLLQTSRLRNLVEQNVELLRSVERATPTEVEFTEAAYFRTIGEQVLFYYRPQHESGRFAPNIACMQDVLRRMKQLVGQRGARFAAAILPAEYSVDEGAADEILSRLPLDRQGFDLTLAQQILARELVRLGVPYLDLRETFRAGGGSRLYLRHDTHWNAEGNRLASQTLTPFLAGLIQEHAGW